MRSCRRSLRDFVQVVMKRSCEDPAHILRSLHDLAQVLIRRSCGDLGEVHSKRFLHDLVQCAGPCQKILWRSW